MRVCSVWPDERIRNIEPRQTSADKITNNHFYTRGFTAFGKICATSETLRAMTSWNFFFSQLLLQVFLENLNVLRIARSCVRVR